MPAVWDCAGETFVISREAWGRMVGRGAMVAQRIDNRTIIKEWRRWRVSGSMR